MIILVFVCTFYVIAGTIAVVFAVRRPKNESNARLLVIVLKSFCGADPDLERNLVSFFCQDYRGLMQIFFGVQDPRDFVIAIAERVASRFFGGGRDGRAPSIRVRVQFEDREFRWHGRARQTRSVLDQRQ